jgi:CBS domain-containing protein
LIYGAEHVRDEQVLRCGVFDRNQGESVLLSGCHFKNISVGGSSMKVKDAMHKGAEWVTPETPVADLARKMKDLDIGALPVGENDRLIGMVTDRDITCRAVPNGKDFRTLTAREVMSKGIVFCTDTEEVEDALRIMEKNQIRRLPVIDSKKRMVGMLSIGDVSHATSHEMSGEVITAVSAHHA